MHLNKITRALMTAGLCAGLAGPALADAQSDRLQALEKRLDSSLQLIEKLQARVAELERGKSAALPVAAAGAAAVAATAPDVAKAISSLQDSVSQLSEGMSRKGGDQGLPLHGFGDVGAGWSRGNDPIKLRGFNGGTLDLYLTPQFGERVKGLIELAIEYGDDGGVAIDLERLQLGYTVSDALTAWIGRFHTPFGLWNTAFHHGANLQTSIYRPRFIDFEDKGGFIPAHSVGAWGSGRMNVAGGKLGYDLFVANGPKIADRTLDFNAFTDNSGNKMLGFNLSYQPKALAGLTLGLHGFRAAVTSHDDTGAELGTTRLRMLGGYVGYDENDWEVVGEYYRFGNTDVGSGQRHTSQAGFLQVGRTFGLWTPFMRVEKAALAADDLFFRSQASGRSYQRAAFGLRYALDPKSSLKFEFSGTREKAVDLIDEAGGIDPFASRSYRRGSFQYSVAF